MIMWSTTDDNHAISSLVSHAHHLNMRAAHYPSPPSRPASPITTWEDRPPIIQHCMTNYSSYEAQSTTIETPTAIEIPSKHPITAQTPNTGTASA
jgi:hypothetical protein